MSLRVTVSKDVINASVERDSAHCMIAEAIKKSLPDARRVMVDLQTIRFSDMKKRQRYIFLTPKSAQVALVKFDQAVMPEPFRFSLKQPTVIPMVELSEEQRERDRERAAKRRARDPEKERETKRNARSRARIATIRKRKDFMGVKGGEAPPTIPGGARRMFGLRGLTL